MSTGYNSGYSRYTMLNKRKEDVENIIIEISLDVLHSKLEKKFIIESNDVVRKGFIYFITNKDVNFVKIGHWRYDLLSLKTRYSKYYGNDIVIWTGWSDDAMTLDAKLENKFESCNIANELYKKCYLEYYLSYAIKKGLKIVSYSDYSFDELNEETEYSVKLDHYIKTHSMKLYKNAFDEII